MNFTLDFKVQFWLKQPYQEWEGNGDGKNGWNNCISGMGGLIDMERKGCELIRIKPIMWPWTMTLTFDFQDQFF